MITKNPRIPARFFLRSSSGHYGSGTIVLKSVLSSAALALCQGDAFVTPGSGYRMPCLSNAAAGLFSSSSLCWHRHESAGKRRGLASPSLLRVGRGRVHFQNLRTLKTISSKPPKDYARLGHRFLSLSSCAFLPWKVTSTYQPSLHKGFSLLVLHLSFSEVHLLRSL